MYKAEIESELLLKSSLRNSILEN